MDHRRRRSGPVWEGGNVISERSIIDLVNQDAEEGSGLITRVGFKLRINLDYKRGGDGRKQTGLIR
jgi:hypothetical protein